MSSHPDLAFAIHRPTLPTVEEVTTKQIDVRPVHVSEIVRRYVALGDQLAHVTSLLDKDANPSAMAFTIREYARTIVADIRFVVSLQVHGLPLTSAQLSDLEGVHLDVDEIIDTLNWSCEAADDLRETIRSECA